MRHDGLGFFQRLRGSVRGRGRFAILLVLGAVAFERTRSPRLGRDVATAETQAEPVAWPGEVVAREVELPLPRDVEVDAECTTAQESWRFDDRTRATLAHTAALSEEARRALVDGARCDAHGCALTPTTALLDALTPAARDAVYPALARHAENRLHADPFLRPVALGPWSHAPGIAPEAARWLAQGTWSVRGHFAFSDLAWLCAKLSEGDRVATLRALHTRATLDAAVRVPTAEDVAPMVAYWRAGGDDGSLRSVFEAALARGEAVPVARLLGPMARGRLGRFPAATEAASDGFWTAAHFADAASAPERLGPAAMRALLRERYASVSLFAGRFGDVVALFSPAGDLVQTANLVARDVVFVKDGDARDAPWTLTHLDALLTRHRGATPSLWRRRGPAVR